MYFIQNKLTNICAFSNKWIIQCFRFIVRIITDTQLNPKTQKSFPGTKFKIK